jgi:vanillate O-demethylase monooxygenase subunit
VGIGVHAYPLVERGPLIWGWLGNGASDPARIPALPWIEDGTWACSQGYFHLPGNYVSLHENLLDLTHLSYVHAGTFGTPDYAAAPYETQLDEGHYAITRRVAPTRLPDVWARPTGLEHEHAARIATSEFLSPALHVVTVVFYDNDLPEGRRTELKVRTAHLVTPETSGSTHYFIVHGRDFAQADGAITSFMHSHLFCAFNEDVAALTKLERVLADPGAPFFEISVASDAASVAMRRYLRRRAATPA